MKLLAKGGEGKIYLNEDGDAIKVVKLNSTSDVDSFIYIYNLSCNLNHKFILKTKKQILTVIYSILLSKASIGAVKPDFII